MNFFHEDISDQRERVTSPERKLQLRTHAMGFKRFLSKPGMLPFLCFWMIGLGLLAGRLWFDVKTYRSGNTLTYRYFSRSGYDYLLHLPKGYTDFDGPRPLIVFLHGAGEVGKDVNILKRCDMVHYAKESVNAEDFPFVVVSPMAPKHGWEPHRIVTLLDELLADTGKRKGKRGRGAAGKVPVFGILSRKSKVFVEVVSNVTSRTLLSLTVKKVRRGSIIYTDKFRGYDALMYCGYKHLSVDHSSRFCQGKVHINGLEGFWSWAKERLFKHHGISPRWFPLYLKELEFRYNHRKDDLFFLLVKMMSDFVPSKENTNQSPQ